jgi:hypothetical protein
MVLFEAVTGQFAGDGGAASSYFIDAHPAGWSQLASARNYIGCNIERFPHKRVTSSSAGALTRCRGSTKVAKLSEVGKPGGKKTAKLATRRRVRS